MNTLCRVITRKKVLDPISTEQSQLGRVLNTIDLTALGVGSTLGVGVYVLAGQVAKDTAGPAVVLSFLIATVASVFAGLCYAEFGARTPRAGSAYIYSYVCVGEFVAFVVGWNLILEYVIGSASVARGLSLYLDTLINNTLKDTFIDIAPLGNVSFMSAYFDFFAFGISVILALALAFGLKESTWANNIFTLVNLLVVGFVVIAGSTKAKSDNWHVEVDKNCTYNDEKGCGGFFPFGVEGMIKGAATCFYGFVGFDCIATTGEEVKNPKKAIPFAIVVSLFIIFLAYFGTSTVVTLMVPYYAEDRNAPLPHAFESVGMDWAKWVVAIGGIFSLCASLFGAMFPLPRIIYAMASDSLIFRFLGQVSSRFRTPVVGTLLAGLLTGLMAALFELKQLVDMMSIGTLLAYTIVAASVLLLRYENEKDSIYAPLIGSLSDSEENETYTENRSFDTDGENSDELELTNDDITSSNIFKQIFNCGRQKIPSQISERIVRVELCLYCVLCIAVGLCAMYMKNQIGNGETWAIVITVIIVSLTILVVMSMTTQPKSNKELSFKVPLVPLIPALSILINIYLMLMLDRNTWIRFGVWMAVGLPTYYFSIKIQSDARNESIYSRSSVTANGKINGLTNHSFDSNEHEIINNEPKKRPAPPPPTLLNIEATIADLDKMLENEEANINDRKYSVHSLSIASNVLRQEDVQADVHCSDVPVTLVAPPLIQSSNPLSSTVANYPDALSKYDDPDMDPASHSVTSQEELIYDEITQSQPEDEFQIESSKSKEVDESKAYDPVSNYIEFVPPTVPIENPNVNENELLQQSEAIHNEPVLNEAITKNEVIIPPPPPLTKDIIDFDNIPKSQVQLNALTSVKLKPVQQKVPDSRQNSVVPSQDNHIKFGTPEYKEFLEQLDQTLHQGYVPPVQHTDLKKKLDVINNSARVVNENVMEDKIDQNDAKQKLAAFYERTNSLPFFNNRNHNNNNIVKNVIKENKGEKNSDLSDYKEKHRQNMETIFRSVRLRKTDSFTEDDKSKPNSEFKVDSVLPRASFESNREKLNDKNNDHLVHKQNMDGIFRSIRLRKVDSFKSNESQ